MRKRRRYELQHAELNRMIEALVERSREVYGQDERAGEYVRQILVSGVRLLREGAGSGDLKLINSTLKELRHSFHVFAPYARLRKVTVFGSARTPPDHPDWRQAHDFAERIVREGWMVITGAGDGIMGAAQGGAGREASFGVNVRLPFEQQANKVIAGDPKLINFRYFFTRKVVFVKEAHAIALFPGGFGTLDEGLEALTLIQTGKGEILPVVFIDAPGGSYWKDWEEAMRQRAGARGLISPEDLHLFKVTDDINDAVHEILDFYSNYHSSRYVGDRLVLRVRHAPNEAELEELNRDFKDIVTRGRIEVGSALAREKADAAADAGAEVHAEGADLLRLPRVLLRFNRRDVGRLRLLIDRLNALAAERASPPLAASPHEIVEQPLSAQAEREELEED